MKNEFSLSYFAYRNMKMDTFEKIIKKYETIYIQDKGTMEEYFSKQYALEPDEIQKINFFFSYRKEKLREEKLVVRAIKHANVHIFEIIKQENMFFDFWEENETLVGHVIFNYYMSWNGKERLKEILSILLSMNANVEAVRRIRGIEFDLLSLIESYGLFELLPVLEEYKHHFPEEFNKKYRALRLKNVFK